jgi:hypothetical protein
MILSMVHERIITDKIADHVHTGIPELKWLMGTGQQGFDVGAVEASGRLNLENTGSSIDFEYEYQQNTTVGAYSRYGPITTTPQEGFSRGMVDWSQYGASTTIDGFSERVNGPGMESLFRILRAKSNQTMKSFKDTIGDDLWKQNNSVVSDSLILHGFPYYVGTDPTTGTAAGINRATTGNEGYRNRFNGTSQAVTETAPSFSQRGVEDLFDIMLEASPGEGGEVDIWFCGDTVMGYIFKRMANAIVYTQTDNADVMFSRIQIHGRPVVHTKKVPSGRVYGFTSDTWYLAVHPQANFTAQPFQKPYNQDARVALTLLQCNLVCVNPRWNLVYSGIVA